MPNDFRLRKFQLKKNAEFANKQDIHFNDEKSYERYGQ